LDGAFFRQLMRGLPSAVHLMVTEEPIDDWIDGARQLVESSITAGAPTCVISIGGGSALDAGKALAAMLAQKGMIADYLEGVGHCKPSGRMNPWYAIPTTGGTGSEATTNAVIGRGGANPFKKSLRHPAYRPAGVILDGELALGQPPQITAACGLDALTQLLESYLSPTAEPDLLPWLRHGIGLIGRALPSLMETGAPKGDEPAARQAMAEAAFLSGVGLSRAGLGTVHGWAGLAGAHSPVPHGLFCAHLIGPVLRASVDWLRKHPTSQATEAIHKLAQIAPILAGPSPEGGRTENTLIDEFVETLVRWPNEFGLPSLRASGLTSDALPAIIHGGSNRNNPAELDRDTWRSLLHRALEE
jgi:alcohol dehydrogenase